MQTENKYLHTLLKYNISILLYLFECKIENIGYLGKVVIYFSIDKWVSIKTKIENFIHLFKFHVHVNDYVFYGFFRQAILKLLG